MYIHIYGSYPDPSPPWRKSPRRGQFCCLVFLSNHLSLGKKPPPGHVLIFVEIDVQPFRRPPLSKSSCDAKPSPFVKKFLSRRSPLSNVEIQSQTRSSKNFGLASFSKLCIHHYRYIYMYVCIYIYICIYSI